MKLYTKEMFLKAAEKCEISMIDAQHIMKYIDEYVTPIELPSDEEIFWNTETPMHIDNYIVHRGAEGVSLGWWNGEEWIQVWSSKKINVYGWIKIPNTPIEWMRNKILNK